MSMPASMAWYRNTECIAWRTRSLPRNENDRLETPPEMCARGSLADAPRRLDEVEAVAVVLLDARGDGEDVGIEDDVLGREADLLGQEPVGALADLDLAVGGVGLALLVERHDDDGGTVAPHLAGMLEKMPPRLPSARWN